MPTLPIEQVLQRQTCNIVSGPGVVLWGSSTDDWDMVTWTADVDVIDEVEAGEVELAQMAPPEFFWEIEVNYPPFGPLNIYGMGEYGEDYYGTPYSEESDDPWGLFQNMEYGEFDFGDGPFGGVETVWYIERPRYGYTMTGDE